MPPLKGEWTLNALTPVQVNVDGTRAIIKQCKALGHFPRLVFSSSVAVYGPLPASVTVLQMLSTLNSQKNIAIASCMFLSISNLFPTRVLLDYASNPRRSTQSVDL